MGRWIPRQDLAIRVTALCIASIAGAIITLSLWFRPVGLVMGIWAGMSMVHSASIVWGSDRWGLNPVD